MTHQSQPKTVNVQGIDYWINEKGNHIHPDNVDDIDKIRDDFVRKSMQKFLDGIEYLKNFKRSMLSELDEFLELSASDYDKEYKGSRGGFTLETFNGEYRIRVCISDTQQVDERIEIARNMLKAVMRRWADEGINPNIRTIIEEKYALNEKGEVNVKEMLSLRRYKFTDEDWKQAIDAITDSLFTSGSKSYLRFYTRNNETGKFDQLKADFSTI